MIEYGVVKHQTRYDNVFFKAVLAGAFLSTGGLLLGIIEGGSPQLNSDNPGLVKILGGAVFPVGLVMIVLTGQELLTSNMMVLPMAWMKGAIPWWSTFVDWIIVFSTDLFGSLFFAAVLVKYYGVISTAPYQEFAVNFAIKKAGTPEWHQIFLRGIACNWLVCIAVWQSTGSKETISIQSSRIPIWIFVACGYDHVVANMFLGCYLEQTYVVAAITGFGTYLSLCFFYLSVAQYIMISLIAAFIGNVVGALCVAVPAVYFYLTDYDYRRDSVQLRGVEEGEGLNEIRIDSGSLTDAKRNN